MWLILLVDISICILKFLIICLIKMFKEFLFLICKNTLVISLSFLSLRPLCNCAQCFINITFKWVNLNNLLQWHQLIRMKVLNNYLQSLNQTRDSWSSMTTKNTQVVATTIGVPPLSKYLRKEFTPLFEYVHSIMTQLLNNNVFKLPRIKPIDPSKPFSPYHDAKYFCQYHRQPNETEICHSLRSRIHDLIHNNTISIAGVNDKWNKSIAPPNQNLKISLILCLLIILMWLSLRILPFLLMILALSLVMWWIVLINLCTS